MYTSFETQNKTGQMHNYTVPGTR